MTNLTEKHCVPCEGIIAPCTKAAAENFLAKTPEWQLNAEATKISRAFQFKNFYQTMAFVNAIAWIANRENHHPDLEVGFNYCRVNYMTHAANGLTENDFICAAKINALF